MRRFMFLIVLGGLLLAACGGGVPQDTPAPPISDPSELVDEAPLESDAPSSTEGDSQAPVETEDTNPELEALQAVAEDPCGLTPVAVLEEQRDITVMGDLTSESGTDPETGTVTGLCSYWEQYRLTIVVPASDVDIDAAFSALLPENNTELDDIRGESYWGFDTLTLYVLRDGFWITVENLDTADESPLVAPRALFSVAERRLPSP